MITWFIIINVMHVEKNMFDNIMNNVMDIDQIEDNNKARQDLEEYCRHLSWTCNN